MIARGAVIAMLVLAALAPAAYAQGGPAPKNKRGKATLYQARCKYGVFGPRGVLQVGTRPPLVSGANTKRRTRRERTRVRYRVSVTDAFQGFGTLVTSGWSDFIRVRQSQRRTWTGFTSWDMEWRGNYGLDVRIEWWTSRRRVGWRDYQINAFQFFDQYNTGPFGPISSCYKYTAY